MNATTTTTLINLATLEIENITFSLNKLKINIHAHQKTDPIEARIK